MSPRKIDHARLDVQLDGDVYDSVRSEANSRGTSISEVVRRSLVRIGHESGPYSFSPGGYSLVRDLWNFHRGNDHDGLARDRLHRFDAWNDDVVKFAQINTTSAADVLPPGYRVVTELVATSDRPLVAATERQTISDASPFTVPTVDEPLNVIDEARVEGAEPVAGDFTTTGVPVEPKLIVGSLELTRELVDAASPAGDLIALQVAAEDYRRKVEARIYAEINAEQQGAITAGFTPSGVQASTSTGTALADDLKVALARYASVRLRKARNVIAGGEQAEVLAPLLDETTGDDTAMWKVQGARINAATTTFAAGAGDADVVILGAGDVWSWESPLLRFRMDEKKGPAVVELAVSAYSAVKVVRTRGVSVIRWAAI